MPTNNPIEASEEAELDDSQQQTGNEETGATPSKAARPEWEFPLPEATPESAPDDLELRELLQQMVFNNLVGPEQGEEEEVGETYVSEHYLCGMIAPRTRRFMNKNGGEEDGTGDKGVDTLESAEKPSDDGPADPPPAHTKTMFPSSMGMTFTLPLDVETIRVTASFGHYKRQKSETGFLTKTGEPETVWKRYPVHKTHDFSLADLGEDNPANRFLPDDEHFKASVYVKGRARKRKNEWIVSLFLVNDSVEPKESSDTAWLFQTHLKATDPQGKAIFKQHTILLEEEGVADEVALRERRQLLMAYRKCVAFGAGHNASIHAERHPENTKCAFSVETRALPRYEVERQDAPSPEAVKGLDGINLSMDWLATASRDEVLASLRNLESAYDLWLKEREVQVDTEADLKPFADIAKENLEDCQTAKRRIAEGIAMLETDAQAFSAFQFTNRTMSAQRVRSLYGEAKRRDKNARLDTFDKVGNRSWRPFQLAFILINLPSLCQPSHHDRTSELSATGDLLWFPTGGGKTEAYLGLTAFTLAIRRLQGVVAGRDGNSGVAVLMRYTLRLLTLQQFQRAAALICACEIERRKNPKKWGVEPFRLGLWVGAKTTPNRVKDSDEAIKTARDTVAYRNRGGSGATPAQLTNCPWCAAKIDVGKDFRVDNAQLRTFIFCPNFAEVCPFTEQNSSGEGIPAIVVDEEIYRRLPSLLIATVDKFAQMPWNGRTGMLFGQVTGRCPRHGFLSPEIEDPDFHPATKTLPASRNIAHGPLRPPDLIIQDELHLISGPLGTLVGLYETAVDALCSWEVDGKRVRPKVVASTATIRNAQAQMNALFLRKVAVFPPPALDADDNFFSRRTPSSVNKPGRLYVGVCAPGKRLKASMIRVYTAYMAAAHTLYLKYGKQADPYLTTVGYFNSMRELGGMRRLVEDDVASRLGRITERGLKKRYLSGDSSVVELTSRRSASDIPDILDQMSAIFDPKAVEERKRAYKEKTEFTTKKPIDVLLATNMISVGVDVPRLGLMIVAGQPKSTAEYIQATSRVGRQKPGLVCTVFNWARPRDLSHFEGFEHYHSTFYQHVEALSVTPFSPRALDRGLTALLVALIRLEDARYNRNESAQIMDQTSSIVRDAVRLIEERAQNVTLDTRVGDEVKNALQKRLDDWTSRAAKAARGAGTIGFEASDKTVALLEKPSAQKWDWGTCLNSLRDVEPMSNLVFQDVSWDD